MSHRTAVWLGLLLGAVPGAAARGRPPVELLSFAYTSDHKRLLNKTDDWKDPVTALEKATIGVPAAPLPGAPGGGGPRVVPLASHTWGEVVRATVTLRLPSPGGADPATMKLSGDSELPAFRFASVQPPVIRDGLATFDVIGAEALPRRIAALEGEVRWRLSWRGGATPLGRTRHAVLVLAGSPRPAEAWPVTGRGTDPPRPDHNAFTAFRLRAAVQIADGATSANAAAERAWRTTIRHYDLAADSDLNPWALLAEGTGGQCMTTAAFVEAAVDILGFPGGHISYVYPTLRRPKNPAVTAIPNAHLPGAFTVEASDYDIRGQFRTVAGVPIPRAGEHSVAQAALHKGAHGIERLKMRDYHGQLHNYATAFVVEEGGTRSYYGGGYSTAPYHSADSFLAAACTAVVWAYEEGDSDEWESVCERPGPALVWATGSPFRD